ncbi:MAG: uncharacterized protein JWN44_5361 [Myxococcales bacterium]|nr:uncharacterized protein [Myxococcales bacterium]
MRGRPAFIESRPTYSVIRVAAAVVCGWAAAACTPNQNGDDAGGLADMSAPSDESAPADQATAIQVCPGVPAGQPTNDPWQRERSTVDLVDDVPGAFQVHVLYVEPSDRTATTPLDTNGSLRRSVTAFNAWLVDRTGGPKLRFDTCKGTIDVTYVKLPSPFTERELADGTTLSPNGPPFVRERLEAELSKTFTDPNKLYLVYYDGLAFGRCGGAAYPPTVHGHFTGQYIGGIFAATFLTASASAGAQQLVVADPTQLPLPAAPFSATLGSETVSVQTVQNNVLTIAAPLATSHAVGDVLQAATHPPDCRSNAFSVDGAQLNYWEYSGVHECMHPLGIVDARAQDFAPAPVAPGHLSASNPGAGVADLMYQGTSPWGCPTFPSAANAAASPCELDPLHRNYFMVANGSGAIDLANSVFLDPSRAGALPPPGW